MSIFGIPTSRISDAFFRQRLLSQVQSDQLDLFRLQSQLSTGRLFDLPSEKPAAALRVIRLQGLIERKTQVQTNLATNQSYLTATDSAMAAVSNLITDAKAVALGVIDTVSTDEQRVAAAQSIRQIIQQATDIANTQFRGRYLFAGSTSQIRPFEMIEGGGIRYTGNEESLLSYADLGLLFETNVPGGEVFGAISDPVRGSVDLNPVLTYNTRLADLHGGEGVPDGSIAVSDGQTTSIVDLSSAETIGDVAALLRASPPQGRTVDVEITPTGLKIQLASAAGNLTIKEVGEGSTARRLGILTPVNPGNTPVIGKDLNPVLRETTRLSDMLGSRAAAAIHSYGTDNDIILQAGGNGDSLNGVTLRFVDDPAVSPGNEQIDYDPAAGTITVRIDEGRTQARHVVAALNDPARAPGLPFNARLDPLDEQLGGLGLITATPAGEVAGVTGGGSGQDFDRAAGLQIVNGQNAFTIDLSAAETVEDLLNALNGSGAGVLAKINASGTGIDVRSRVSGTGFAIGENGGSTATQLGLRSFTEATRLDDLNFGLGVNDASGTDFVITRADGVELEIDVSGLDSIDDLLQAINGNPANTPLVPGAPPALTARLATYGNGIELVDNSVGPGSLSVRSSPAGTAAVELGLIPKGQDSTTAPPGGPPQVLSGADTAKQEVQGVFTALIQLLNGLQNSDMPTIERAIGMLEESYETVNFARAELGAKQQALDGVQARLEDENIQLRSILSDEYDADLVEVISNLTARQASFEASLQSTAQILTLSLLDYL
jgi:flagellin-like hook-associated protein FlgL